MAYPKHAQHNGGKAQSQKIHYCTLCDDFGEGNRFYGHHIRSMKCQGRGVQNHYAKLRSEYWRKRFSNLF